MALVAEAPRPELRAPAVPVPGRALVCTFASWLVVLTCLAGVASGAGQAPPDAQDAPTAVEQALIEHQCSGIRATRPADIVAYDTCLSTQLLSLRTDFGRDLARLSPADRRIMDAACNKIRTAEGRDAYVACLSRQLVSLRSRRGVGTAQSSQATAAAPPAASSAPTVQPPPTEKKSAFSLTLAMIGAAVLMAAVAAGAGLVMKRRRPSSVCRICGTPVPGGGDLCQRCRHQAAEAQRRAAFERAQSERTNESPSIGEYEVEDGQAGQVGQVGDIGHVGRVGQVGEIGPVGRVGQAGEMGQVGQVGSWGHDELRRSYEIAESGEFDPHVILGLLPNASRETIEAAYQEARARYDAEQVAHLGPEAREHFRVKAEAVERAYRMLAGGDNASQQTLV